MIDEVSGAGRSVGYALVGGDRQIERSTPGLVKRHGLDGELGPHAEQIAALLSGQLEPVTISWEGGSAELGPVVDREGEHHVLLTVRSDEASTEQSDRNALLDDLPEDGPAIVWLKDLQGRYLHVNGRYAAHVGAAAEELLARTDEELSHRESIDGLRVHRLGAPVDEPLQLEYIVPAFENRPALVVLRFPIRNRGGEPVAVCGVAAPSGEAHVARLEAARLMEIESSSWLEPEALRAKVLIEWGVRPVEPVALPAADELQADRPEPAAFERGQAQAPVGPEVMEELADLREALATALRERDAAVNQRTELVVEMEQAAERVAELLRERDASASELRAEVDVARTEAEAMATALEEAQKQRDEAAGARNELERALEDTKAQLADLLNEREADDSELRTELNAARNEVDRTKATLSELQRELDRTTSTLAEAEQAKIAVAESLAQAESENVNLARSNTELAQELESAKQQIAELMHEREADESELREQLDAVRNEAEAANGALEEAVRNRDEAQNAHGSLERVLNEHQQRAHELEHEVDRLRAELERAQHDSDERGREPSPLMLASEEDSSRLGWSPAAQRAVSAALSNASDWRSGLKSTVKVLGSNGGWDLVTAWLSDEHGALSCGATWASDRGFAEFETLTWQTREAAIRSILSRELPARTATWVNGIGNDFDGDPRLSDAARLGIRTAVFVPVRDGASPLGVLELLTRTDFEPDPEISAALEGVAIQLGHFSHLLARAGRAHWHFGRF